MGAGQVNCAFFLLNTYNKETSVYCITRQHEVAVDFLSNEYTLKDPENEDENEILC